MMQNAETFHCLPKKGFNDTFLLIKQFKDCLGGGGGGGKAEGVRGLFDNGTGVRS